jgi:hypothetical protein
MAQQFRERIDKWDYVKLKSFFTTKEIVCKLKRLPTEWQKIFPRFISGKEIIIRIYMELKKLNSSKFNDPMKKWAKELNRAVSKKENKIAKKTHEEIFNIPHHKANANQKLFRISPHSS